MMGPGLQVDAAMCNDDQSLDDVLSVSAFTYQSVIQEVQLYLK